MTVRSSYDIMVHHDPQRLLLTLFRAMVEKATPARLLPPCLPHPPRGRTLVVGAGKAAAAMAKAAEDNWTAPLSGLVVTRYGHGLPCRRVEVIEAGHPFPDSAGAGAAARMLDLVRGLSVHDLVFALFSGGGSALLTLPAPGLTIADLQDVNRQLLVSGAAIDDINCMRKHLSAITGGRLGVACSPAPVRTFLISDVPGDDPAVIASGPTVADPTTFADARAVAERHRLLLPDAVRRHLEEAADETPKPGDPRLAKGETVMLATPGEALEAAAARAQAAGLEPIVLGATLQGEARALAAAHADLIRTIRRRRGADGPPAVLLSGGETTVTVRGEGRGGRNTEYLLALGLALETAGGAAPGVFALAADTDGIDGTEANAGAFLRPDTLQLAAAGGLDPRLFLEANDSHGFFEKLGDLLTTGPTRTNVNDFRAVLLL
ncbi:MAG: glycerate kinase [bacterium]